MIFIAAEFPDISVGFLPNTLMAQIDRWHFDARDGTVTVDADGEGHQPPIIQGSDLILEIQTLGNISQVPNDLSNVTFEAKFRGLVNKAVEATATFTHLADVTVIRMEVSAADTAAMTERRGLWDCEATWNDATLGRLRTRRVLQGNYILDPEQTK